ncbi:putative uncharacterized protein [Xanthomonas citri pv. punicae str. LMG 859]|nr:putative uncharacterized protein [Xanthomonas citri pv. punicae str. LMG 859]
MRANFLTWAKIGAALVSRSFSCTTRTAKAESAAGSAPSRSIFRWLHVDSATPRC